MTLKTVLLGTCSAMMLAGFSVAGASAETLTIATVNNGDMVRMQGLTSEFTKANPDIQVNWVTLEENVLRERVTTDIAANGGQYDIVTVGNYEVPIWAKQKWLLPLDGLGANYDMDDLLPAIRGGLSVDGKLYAAPFYGESAMIMYRKDLFEKAGLKMPESPTWEFIGDAARKITTARPASTAFAFAARPAGVRTWRSCLLSTTPSAAAGSTKSGSRSSISRNGSSRLPSTQA